MTDAPFCLMLPGTLCDDRLFAPMLETGSPMGSHRQHRVANLHGLLVDTRAWWEMQLAHLPEHFDVLGFSLGAVLALQLLGIAPERVRRLVLVAGNSAAGNDSHRERVSLQRALWQSQGPASVATQMLEQASAMAAEDRHRQLVLQMACDTPTPAFMVQGEVNATRPDGLSWLAGWKGPLLLVSGADDPWCGADKQMRMCSVVPGARWSELAQCGHYVPLEQPRVLAELTDSFLREPDPRQRSNQ